MHWMMASSGMDAEDEYEKFVIRMNPPRVSVDNSACQNTTLVKVESTNKHGILLEVVQVLTDLNLTVSKAYISSDGEWFMDVFHVTDKDGNKLTDEGIVEYIQKAVGAHVWQLTSVGRGVGNTDKGSKEHTTIELTGTDRPGLLSEVFALLAELGCNVVGAEVWTHNTRVAAVVYINDEVTGGPIEDPEKLSKMKLLLSNVLSHSPHNRHGRRTAKTAISAGITHIDRRLHQLMYADRDYERLDNDGESEGSKPMVSVLDCEEKGYSVVNVKCRDRPKLLFDTVCTLTDMQYVVFHGTINTNGLQAFQEYYIRHVDGSPVSSEPERKRIIHCIEAAIERRVSEGLRLELCSVDRMGLLSDVMRIFRENGLSVSRAEVRTSGGKAINVFYVTDTQGNRVTAKTVEAVRSEIGQAVLQVREGGNTHCDNNNAKVGTDGRFSIGNLFRSKSERFLLNLGLIKHSS